MKRAVTTLVLALLAFGLPIAAKAQQMVADGDLADWGINPVDPTAYDKPDSHWLSSLSTVASFIEDDIDIRYVNPQKQYKVGPGYGGQNFDIERMYLAYDQDYLYVAIVSGVDQAGQWDPYRNRVSEAGDIFFDLGCDGVWDFAVETSPGAGGVYRDATPATVNDWWIGGYDFNQTNPANIIPGQSQLIGTLATGLADGTYEAGDEFIYTDAAAELDGIYGPEGYGAGNEAAYRADHNVIELVMPWTIVENAGWSLDFGSGLCVETFHTMACGNDYASLPGPDTMIPEPGTAASLTFGLGALAAFARRRKKA